MNLRRAFVLGGVICAALVSSAEAGGYFGGGFEGGYGCGPIPGPYAGNYLERLPYYSLHPPVYYSMPVPRTYGYSPFAYPGYVPTPEVELTGSMEVINPHVLPSQESDETPDADETSVRTAKVQVIVNPFVENAKNFELTGRKTATDL